MADFFLKGIQQQSQQGNTLIKSRIFRTFAHIRICISCQDLCHTVIFFIFLIQVIKEIKAELAAADDRVDAAAILEHRADTLQQEMEQEDKANALSSSARKGYQLILHTLRQDAKELRMKDIRDANAAFLYIKEAFDEQVGSMQAESSRISQELANLFAFVEKIFGDGNEMLILVTDLTVNADSMKFISRNGSKEYFKYNKKYQLYERQQEIADALEQLQI